MNKYKIIHIDDHILLAKGIQQLIQSVIPDCRFRHFQDGDIAFEYVSEAIKKNKKIDMVITDIVHPGVDGYTFSWNIRKMEKKRKTEPLMILALTVLSKSLPKFQNAIKKKIFNDFVHVDSKAEVLISSVKKGLNIPHVPGS